MNVLSLFDGMSCGRIALDRLGIKVDNYYSSEIDKYAMQVSEANYPDIIQIGDVTKINYDELPQIDLIMGGSPCQGFSFAGKQLAFDDPRSALFFCFWRAVKHLKPKYFLLENVRMKKEYLDVISEYMRVEPIMINSALVSAQNRVRFYWTNIPGIEQPEQRGIVLRDILEDGFDSERDKSYCIDAGAFRGRYEDDGTIKQKLELRQGGKTNSLTTVQKDNVVTKDNVYWRKLTPVECERLQTVPDNYTNHVSNTQRYKMLGNGWTIETITHILKNMEKGN
jgi:site-specific DNA-cytosine methylase